jgi:hypothetical protein
MANVRKSAGELASVISSTTSATGNDAFNALVPALALRDGNRSIRELIDLYMTPYSDAAGSRRWPESVSRVESVRHSYGI